MQCLLSTHIEREVLQRAEVHRHVLCVEAVICFSLCGLGRGASATVPALLIILVFAGPVANTLACDI